jgi:hypothetical protein
MVVLGGGQLTVEDLIGIVQLAFFSRGPELLRVRGDYNGPEMQLWPTFTGLSHGQGTRRK